MYGTYLRLDITVHDGWRAVVRAASRKLTRQVLRDPKHRAARKRFYRGFQDRQRSAILTSAVVVVVGGAVV